MEANKVDIHKKKLLDALNDNYGIVSRACKSVGLSRTTYYDYYNEDADFAKLADEGQENAIDHVEGKLFEKIDGVQVSTQIRGEEVVYSQPPSDTAIIFYLKTKGKKRGYVERQDIGVEKITQISFED